MSQLATYTTGCCEVDEAFFAHETQITAVKFPRRSEESIREIHPLSEEFRDTFLDYIDQYEQTNAPTSEQTNAPTSEQTNAPTSEQINPKTLLIISNIPLFILVALFIYSFISNGFSKIPKIISGIRAIIIISFIIQLLFIFIYSSPPSYIFILMVATYLFILITHLMILRNKSTGNQDPIEITANYLNPLHSGGKRRMNIGS